MSYEHLDTWCSSRLKSVGVVTLAWDILRLFEALSGCAVALTHHSHSSLSLITLTHPSCTCFLVRDRGPPGRGIGGGGTSFHSSILVEGLAWGVRHGAGLVPATWVMVITARGAGSLFTDEITHAVLVGLKRSRYEETHRGVRFVPCSQIQRSTVVPFP